MKFDLRHRRARDERVKEAHFQYTKGSISRREFLRFSAAMGAGALGVNLLSPMERLQVARSRALMQSATPQRGGTAYVGAFMDATNTIADPAKINSVFVSNIIRQVCEYLVRIDADLTLQPALATSWMPSQDGLTWTLNLRQGVKFNHGKDFKADDVVFTISRLIDPATASAFAGAAPYVTGAEKVDDYTVNIHTNRVAADFIYSLFLYVAAVLPSDWPGDFNTNPWGTGPFTIKAYDPGQHVSFQRRDNYWAMGADNQALPYLDGIDYTSYQTDLARLTALQDGSVQLVNGKETLRDQYSALTGFTFVTVQTANLDDAIMHFNEEPWTNSKVREAVKLCFDRQAYVDTRFVGLAVPANDQPIAPGSYALAPASVTPRTQDYDQAKQLLSEAGYPNGFAVTLIYIDPQSDGDYTEPFAQFLAAQLQPAGITATLQPDPHYFNRWLDDWGPFFMGADNWSQKNTASEMFNLAYRSTGIWNESHWKNPDFDTLLDQFDQELNQDTRKGQLSQLMDMLSSDGPVMIPAWRQDAAVIDNKLHYRLHPQSFVWMADAWLEQS